MDAKGLYESLRVVYGDLSQRGEEELNYRRGDTIWKIY